jgi:hypothetical protein
MNANEREKAELNATSVHCFNSLTTLSKKLSIPPIERVTVAKIQLQAPIPVQIQERVSTRVFA